MINLASKDIPRIIYEKENPADKKKITRFLLDNKIEFSPTRLRTQHYEAVIKVSNSPIIKKNISKEQISKPNKEAVKRVNYLWESMIKPLKSDLYKQPHTSKSLINITDKSLDKTHHQGYSPNPKMSSNRSVEHHLNTNDQLTFSDEMISTQIFEGCGRKGDHLDFTCTKGRGIKLDVDSLYTDHLERMDDDTPTIPNLKLLLGDIQKENATQTSEITTQRAENYQQISSRGSKKADNKLDDKNEDMIKTLKFSIRNLAMDEKVRLLNEELENILQEKIKIDNLQPKSQKNSGDIKNSFFKEDKLSEASLKKSETESNKNINSSNPMPFEALDPQSIIITSIAKLDPEDQEILDAFFEKAADSTKSFTLELENQAKNLINSRLKSLIEREDFFKEILPRYKNDRGFDMNKLCELALKIKQESKKNLAEHGETNRSNNPNDIAFYSEKTHISCSVSEQSTRNNNNGGKILNKESKSLKEENYETESVRYYEDKVKIDKKIEENEDLKKKELKEKLKLNLSVTHSINSSSILPIIIQNNNSDENDQDKNDYKAKDNHKSNDSNKSKDSHKSKDSQKSKNSNKDMYKDNDMQIKDNQKSISTEKFDIDKLISQCSGPLISIDNQINKHQSSNNSNNHSNKILNEIDNMKQYNNTNNTNNNNESLNLTPSAKASHNQQILTNIDSNNSKAYKQQYEITPKEEKNNIKGPKRFTTYHQLRAREEEFNNRRDELYEKFVKNNFSPERIKIASTILNHNIRVVSPIKQTNTQNMSNSRSITPEYKRMMTISNKKNTDIENYRRSTPSKTFMRNNNNRSFSPMTFLKTFNKNKDKDVISILESQIPKKTKVERTYYEVLLTELKACDKLDEKNILNAYRNTIQKLYYQVHQMPAHKQIKYYQFLVKKANELSIHTTNTIKL